MADMTRDRAMNEYYQDTLEGGLALSNLPEEKGGWAEYFDESIYGEDDPAIKQDDLRALTAIMLENARRLYGIGGNHRPGRGMLDEATRALQVGGFVDYLFPTIRAYAPYQPILDLVSYQPMRQKVGVVFFFDWIAGSNKGSEYTAGDRLLDSRTGWRGGSDYTSEFIEEEILGAGTGAVTTYTTQLDYRPVRPNTITVTAGTVVGRDDGNGAITGAGITSGTIDYETGDITVQFTVAPTVDPVVSYDYSIELSDTLPMIDFQISNATVEAEDRGCRIRWSRFAEQDYAAEFGGNVEAALVQGVAAHMRAETARMVLRDLWDAAGAPVTTFQASPPGAAPWGYPRNAHFMDINYPLNIASNAIYDEIQRAHASWIVADIKASTIIESIQGPSWEPASRDNQKMVGMRYIGRLNGLDVYKDPHLDNFPGASTKGNMLLGYKGPDFQDAGYVFAPYQALTVTERVMLDDMVGRKAFGYRFGRKLIQAAMYKRVAII